MKPRLLILVLPVHLAGALASTAFADSIGINFGAGETDAFLFDTDTAGVVPQGNWNNAEGTGGEINLVDGDGVPSGATLAWAAEEQWSIRPASPPIDANGILLNGWISENGGDSSTIDITGIPYVSYDLYVYTNHDRAQEDVDLSEANGAFQPFRLRENDTDITFDFDFIEQTVSADPDPNLPEAIGNYAVMRGLSASDLNLVMGVAAGSRGAITGLQIVELDANDTDGDGLPNDWEIRFGLDPNDNGLPPFGDPDNGAAGDPDNDGVANIDELDRNTFPNNPDTDGDSLGDGVETGTGTFVNEQDTGTSPVLVDSDGDTLPDGVEDNGGVVVGPDQTGTNPNLADTDDDGLRDDWEVANGIDPNDDGTTDPNNGGDGDPDEDDSPNSEEQARRTDPNDPDSDDDEVRDGAETNDGQFVDADATGTDPLDPDSDGDTLPDGVEDNGGVVVGPAMTGTNPNLADTDGDFLRDDWEIANDRDPLDGEGLSAAGGAIGINFGAGRADATLFDTDVAGVAPQANWNNALGNGGGPESLVDGDGADSGATLEWTTDEEWSVAGPAADPNGVLLTGWIAAWNNDGFNTVRIDGIPFAEYDLVVYFNHDRGTEDTDLSELNGAFETVRLHENDPNVLAAAPLAQQVASADDASQQGNFLIIPALGATTLELIINAAGDLGTGDRGPINALQLVATSSGNPFEITAIDAIDEDIRLTWNSKPGRSYSVEAWSDDSGWLELEDGIPSQGDTTSFTEEGILAEPRPERRYYRVREF